MERGIYKNRERGVFTFDVTTGAYGQVESGYVPPVAVDNRRVRKVSLDFGDAFFLDSFLWKSGYMSVVDSTGYANRDTLHAMVLFYMLSSLPNRNATDWWDGSIARYLYPSASLSSQRISDFLSSIGKMEKRMAFQMAHSRFVLDRYDQDRNLLIDSSGLPNSVRFPLTAENIHNGKRTGEVRIVSLGAEIHRDSPVLHGPSGRCG